MAKDKEAGTRITISSGMMGKKKKTAKQTARQHSGLPRRTFNLMKRHLISLDLCIFSSGGFHASHRRICWCILGRTRETRYCYRMQGKTHQAIYGRNSPTRPFV